jgi:hypothetical protein
MRLLSTHLSFAICVSAIVLYSILVYGFSHSVRLPTNSGHSVSMDLSWHPPTSSWITDLSTVISGSGTYGMYFMGSEPPQHGQYSYCNMEHVREQDYIVPSQDDFELVYVELVSRPSGIRSYYVHL